MKSIRLSLMGYFLALLAVALSAASLLVYSNAEQTLASKQEAMGKLIQAQFQDRRRAAEERLDQDLLTQARSLARLVQVQVEWNRADVIQLSMLSGLVPSGFNPSGYALAPLWLAESMPISPPERGQPPPGPHWIVHTSVRRLLFPYLFKIQLDKFLLPVDSEYFQIDCPHSESYHSDAMAGRVFSPPKFASDQEVAAWDFDDTHLGSMAVRRVVFQASGVAQELGRPGRNQRDRRDTSTGSSRPATPPPGQSSGQSSARRPPPIYVHCAAQKDKLESTLAGFAQERDEELAKVADETRDSLRCLRHWLWGISLIVFAATAAGTYWLVYLGLTPLRRLSCAVSKVSVKDFRLPLDHTRPLPLELRPIAERLTITLDLLKRAFTREKQAAADISHELRTPLAALLTTTELALRKPRSAEHYRELLGDVHASAQQMNQIVERLLTLARLDAGVDRLRVQSVDVPALAQQCADIVRPLADARGLKLTVKNGSPSGNGIHFMHTDPDKLREIVSNLLHNAIQYNRPGGAIDLRVGGQNGKLEVEVQDTGIGISDEVRDRIFERFYRADPSRGGDDLHAGLGLAIVKEYIDLMGGSIGVESIEGQGSIFRVLLPLR